MGRLFGTDGLRGVAGEFPLDAASVELLGRILYFLLIDRKIEPELIIGRDTRESGPALFAALSRGFGKAGGRIDDAGILSTPAIAFLARREKKCAISITASHNEYRDNGIKIFGPDGYKISDQAELEIEPYLLGEKSFVRDGTVTGSQNATDMRDHFRSEYCRYLTKELFGDLSLRGIRVALDCGNGALCEIAPSVMRELGAEVTALNTSPDGQNINLNAGSLHPEVLLAELSKGNYSCGFTFDGDGDRCLAGSGSTLMDGDYILAIAARYLQTRNELKKNEVVATTMSNLGLENFFRENGITLHRVAVGDKNVLDKLQQDGLSLGGEQSGHIIFMNHTFVGDGLLTALMMLRIYSNSGSSFQPLLNGFQKYPQILIGVPVTKKPELTSVPEIRDKMKQIENSLGQSGRMVVRYSGTESVARVMIEGSDQVQIETLARELGKIIQDKLN